MNDATCPYCNRDVEVGHDDGYGLDEDGRFEQECDHCDKTFAYTVCFSIDHETFKADCLNGGDHNLYKVHGYPNSFMRYADCEFVVKS